jgi:hypothetical protein
MELSNGGLIHHPTTRTEPADLVITLTRAQLLAMLGGGGTDGVDFDGDPKTFATITALTEHADPALPDRPAIGLSRVGVGQVDRRLPDACAFRRRLSAITEETILTATPTGTRSATPSSPFR